MVYHVTVYGTWPWRGRFWFTVRSREWTCLICAAGMWDVLSVACEPAICRDRRHLVGTRISLPRDIFFRSFLHVRFDFFVRFFGPPRTTNEPCATPHGDLKTKTLTEGGQSLYRLCLLTIGYWLYNCKNNWSLCFYRSKHPCPSLFFKYF